jgi:hypothetical protein
MLGSANNPHAGRRPNCRCSSYAGSSTRLRNRHVGRVGLAPMAAIEAPHTQAHVRRGGVAERHRRAVLGVHRRRPRPTRLHARPQRRQRFRRRRRRFQLGEDRFQRIEPRREREGVAIDRPAQVLCGGSRLFVCQIKSHAGEMVRLAIARKTGAGSWRASPYR